MIGSVNLTQATHAFTNLKRRISNNAEQLNGLNDTFKHMRNSFEQDPFRLPLSSSLKRDLGFGSIESVPTTHLIRNMFPKEGIYNSIEPTTQVIRNLFPMEGVYQSIVSPDKLEILTHKSYFYNPRTGTLDGGIPMDEVNPAIKENYSIMMEFINSELGVTPIS
ncbi:hypothetical protein Q6247_25160, partial [Klebsiella pneumoniae]